jgi:polyphosphate kinase 2 (PPK2 family)
MNYREKFSIKPDNIVKLNKIDAAFKDKHEDQTSARGEIEKYAQRLRELQYLLYAEDKRSLLIILQAMDAGGKDGTIIPNWQGEVGKDILASLNRSEFQSKHGLT